MADSENLIKVQIKKLHEDVEIPAYAKMGDAGMDIRAYCPKKPIPLWSFSHAIIPTGISVAIPKGYEIQVRPRSGMAAKRGITVLNTPGTIDSGYRGEIGVILYNSTDCRKEIEHGERIAQLVLNKVPAIEWEIVDELQETDRGSGGFGSTGVN